MRGFGDLETSGFAVGSVKGVRWWNLGLDQDCTELLGAWGPWVPGENTAACDSGKHRPPAARCGCGFWAYWLMDALPDMVRTLSVPVLGVVEGFGTTVIGEKGFRCAKARILGLHLPRVTREKTLTWPGARLSAYEYLARRRVADVDHTALLSLLELVVGKTYGVPVYASPEMLFAAHSPMTDYLPNA